MKYIIIFLALLTIPPLAYAAEDDLGSIIKNYKKMNSSISTSGTIGEGGIQALSKQGVKTIIDLRTLAEGTDKDRQAVENLGMRYINIPVTGAGISNKQLAAFTEAMKTVDSPILIHCASGNRVGAMWTSYQLSKGIDVDEAFAEGRAIGMKPSLEEKVKASCRNC